MKFGEIPMNKPTPAPPSRPPSGVKGPNQVLTRSGASRSTVPAKGSSPEEPRPFTATIFLLSFSILFGYAGGFAAFSILLEIMKPMGTQAKWDALSLIERGEFHAVSMFFMGVLFSIAGWLEKKFRN